MCVGGIICSSVAAGGCVHPHRHADSIDRPMDQSPIPINPTRQKTCILIFRWHDEAIALKVDEILGKRQGNARAAASIGGICDGILNSTQVHK